MKIALKKMNLITYGCGNLYIPSLFKPIRNREFVKPEGGLWASPIDSDYGWSGWCRSEEWGDLTTSFTFEFVGNVFVIDSLWDTQQMPWRNPYKALRLEFPDFEQMLQQGIDAIHITVRGERETRFSRTHSLYGRDCESVLVMNPLCIRESENAKLIPSI